MKNINGNLKIVLAFILGIVLTAPVGIYATSRLQANQVKYNDTPLDEVIDELKSGLYDFSKFTTLWRPIPVQNSNITYSGTYTFTEDYRVVVVVRYTNYIANTSYSTTGMTQVFYGDSGVYAEGAGIHIYKNVKSGSKVSYSIKNLNKAGIGVF